jgi:hypothetical protein
MTTLVSLPSVDRSASDRTELHLCFRHIVPRMRTAAWLRTCATYYRAAVMYERLAGLSNAELQRRGLSRATLARDVCEAYDTSAER